MTEEPNDNDALIVREIAELEGDDISQLSGQYYLHVLYGPKRSRVLRTALTTSKSALTKRLYTEENENEPFQLASLLTEHKKISGYAIIGNEAAAEIVMLPVLKLQVGLEN